MEEIQLHSRWGIDLEGEVVDIENLTTRTNAAIRDPDDVFISKMGDLHVLRTRRWDLAEDASTVEALARDELDLLCGCLDVLDGCAFVGLGTIFKFSARGFIEERYRTWEASIRVR